MRSFQVCLLQWNNSELQIANVEGWRKYVSPTVLTCIILQAWINASSTEFCFECKDISNEENSLEHCPTVKGKHLTQCAHVYEAALNSTSLFTSVSQWAMEALLFVTGISLAFISKTSEVWWTSLWLSSLWRSVHFLGWRGIKQTVAKQALSFLWGFSISIKIYGKKRKKGKQWWFLSIDYSVHPIKENTIDEDSFSQSYVSGSFLYYLKRLFHY